MKQNHQASFIGVAAFLLLGILISCDKKPKSSTQELVTDESHTSRNLSINRDIRGIAKTKLQRGDLVSKRLYYDTVHILNQLSDELSQNERLTKAEALNELYVAVSAGQSGVTLAGIKAIFGRAMIESPEEIPARLATMPAGELRTLTITYMRGTDIPLNLLKEIHASIPESLDRSSIAGDLAVRLCLEEGRNEAQKFVDSIEFPTESKYAQQVLSQHLKLSDMPDSPLTKPLEELLKQQPRTR